jgi:hypothetical protein
MICLSNRIIRNNSRHAGHIQRIRGLEIAHVFYGGKVRTDRITICALYRIVISNEQRTENTKGVGASPKTSARLN